MKSYISDSILKSVTKPARYVGGEVNSIDKSSELACGNIKIRAAMCFADIYDIGMSHLGFKMLYHLLNEREDTWCERVFAPWTDMEAKMREHGYKLYALESQTPVDTFDLMGFSLQYEMSYTNILNMLDLAGIPLFSKDRVEGQPFIFAGGPSANNTEPMADFFDFYNLGEGEEMLNEIFDCYAQWKDSNLPRQDFLKMVDKIPGVYVPSLHSANDGFIVKKRVVSDFENAYFPKKMIVPLCEVVHDRVSLEIFRGCIRGCRFCQAGFIYRPVRERSIDRLVSMAKDQLESTGYEEVSLLSLSASDYTNLFPLADTLLSTCEPQHVSLALPSLRVDNMSLDLVKRVSRVRKSGLTLAPEAGTQRLRDVINKGVTEEELEKAVRLAFENGWNNVKLYFMLGLPTETDEDILGIAALGQKVLNIYEEVHRGRKARRPEISISVSTFVPKPFTPFQWEAQDSYDEIIRKQNLLKNSINRKIKFNWHDPETSILEAAISRGDRTIGKVIYEVWKNGAKFDSWSEEMNYSRWMDAFEKVGVTAGAYAERKYEFDEPLAWDHVDIGVRKQFLIEENKKAYAEVITPNCREKCARCGVACYGKGLCVGKIN